ncbi:hypothetical protein B5M42_000225 [Paenibacillus athensensis]|uniref:Uncharacterized protein n=1 Tax=Paenibacillus athensensis TaxID=1967502 RepID=A0A4Y8PQS3_9BACL|nr:hypothetical protein [Paenibacillus athensensis]MCD1257260.1 hypothetical protein [Paenibacillus athensensis]
MNKAAHLIASACAVVLVSTSSAAVWASATDVAAPWLSGTGSSADALHATPVSSPAASPEEASRDGLYAAFYRKAASASQTAALQALEQDRSLGRGVWTREALAIVGALPKEGPRLSAADAARIVSALKQPADVRRAFDAIAGAPDWEGGDRVHRAVYFTGSDRTQAVCIVNGTIVHVGTIR